MRTFPKVRTDGPLKRTLWLATFMLNVLLAGTFLVESQQAADSSDSRKVILVLGDSLAAGYGLDPSEAFPALLQQKIDEKKVAYRVVNAGVSGDTTAGGLRRLDWLLRQRIDVLVVELGGNDGLRGISPEATEANLRAIVERTKAKYPDVRVIIAGMRMPPNMGAEYVARFQNVFHTVAKDTGAALVPFLLEGVGGLAALNQADQIHPTAEGQRVLARNVWQVLGPIIEGKSSRPNIVMMVIDDLGWADIGCNGSQFYQTPQIDRLAGQGVRFTDFYAAGPVCSPTRASILTGKHPARLQLTDWLPGRQDRPSQRLLKPEIQRRLPLEELTLAEALKSAGYVTGYIGKWHLGGQGFLPENQGFDLNVAGDDTGTPMAYFAPFKRGARVMPGLELSEPDEYLTDRLTAEAERFIEQNRHRPFFLYFSHYAVHIPLAAKAALIRKYQGLAPGGSQTNVIYAAMIESVDQSVGRIMAKLKQLQLEDNTIVLFTSDNGGLSVEEGPSTPATSNAPLRAGKGYLYEGGIRVPLIVRWPGMLPAGSLSRSPAISCDLFPTLLAAAGAQAPSELDGVNLLPSLQGNEVQTRDLHWHYPHYSNQGGQPGGAMREGEFKLIERYENGRVELYNLARDLGETNDLAAALPDRATALRAKLGAWRRAVNAQMMEPNPDYQPSAAGHAHVAPQLADGRVFLEARDVQIHGTTVRYEPEPHKNTVGYWTRADDWVSWDFDVHTPGMFQVEILQGCGKGSGGSEVEFALDGQTLLTVVQDTGGFQNFIARDIGEVRLSRSGRYTLSVKPRSKPGLAVMDLRQVTLRPKKG